MAEIRGEVERIMSSVVCQNDCDSGWFTSSPRRLPQGGSDIHALAWNLERGIQFDGIVDALTNRSRLNKDVLMLTELDHGMARSGNRFVAQELAERSSSTTLSLLSIYPCKREAASSLRWRARILCPSTASR